MVAENQEKSFISAVYRIVEQTLLTKAVSRMIFQYTWKYGFMNSARMHSDTADMQ